jgi:mono/diheme cytochrome c family protein
MRALAFIGVLLIAIGVVMGAYLFGGFYTVAAAVDDSGPLAWALTRVRTASVARHAAGAPAIPSGDPAAVQSGARAYAKYGCASCHGAPGVGWSKFSEGLNPGPPDLKDLAKAREPAEIFWVVKNGIRMTGMPSFAKAGASDDEVAQIAAFVTKLSGISDADYKSWTTPQ